MGTVTCRSCDGRGRKWLDRPGKWVDCRACNGTGSNPNLWSTRCEGCRDEIIYKAHTPTPRFCKNCRNKQLEKRCGQSGCTNTIRYSLGWSNIPTYCKRCETKRREGASASLCPGTGFMGCGKVVWSPPGKRFTHCQECSQRVREQEAAKWKEKTCQGLKGQGYCGNTIKYRVDWDRIPDICPQCREKAKAEKAKREANMREKPCAGNCGATIRYGADWEHPPSFCPACKEKRKSRIKAGDLFRSGLIPRGWRAEAEDIDIQGGHITMFFRGRGTNGGGYRVSWDGFGEPHWTDEGLEKNHPDRHRNPLK